jgi:hypothetical protein
MSDWDLANTSTLILGAGFSAAATDGRMPLMSNFFDQLDKKESPVLFDYVSSIDCDVKRANIEAVLLNLDQIRSSPDTVLKGWGEKWKANLTQIQRELERYVLNRIKSALTIQPDNWAIRVLAACGVTTTVISMNYDNIAERVLSDRAHRCCLPCPHCKMVSLLNKSCNCAFRQDTTDCDWRGGLIKPHGSIAWKRCTNHGCCSFECLVADAHCRPFEAGRCPNCCQDCSPAIVMPTMGKHLDDLPEIGVMWQASRRAIADAESLLILGFSMPTSDELLTQMIRATIHANNKLRRVGVIDLDPAAVLDRFRRCLPAKHSVVTNQYPVARGQWPEWLDTVPGAPRQPFFPAGPQWRFQTTSDEANRPDPKKAEG